MSWNPEPIASTFLDAAIGVRAWNSSLDAICEALGAAGATIVPLRGRLPQLPTSSSFQEAIQAYVQDGWQDHDVRFGALPTLRRTGFATDLDFTSEEEMRRSPYYQEWLQPYGLKWFGAVHIKGVEEDWVLSLQRSAQQGPFDPKEGLALAQLSKSLSSSAALANAIGFVKADAALDAFSRSDKAVVMLNRQGEVVRTNAAAEALFSDDINVQNRLLRCTNKESSRKLDNAIWKAGTSSDTYVDEPILLRRKNASPMIAYVSPARGAASDVFGSCQIYVIFVDLFKRQTAATEHLQSLFGLTRAEANFARHICNGGKPRDVATSLGISYETARSHLKGIFSKLDIKSQAELVSLIAHLKI